MEKLQDHERLQQLNLSRKGFHQVGAMGTDYPSQGLDYPSQGLEGLVGRQAKHEETQSDCLTE